MLNALHNWLMRHPWHLALVINVTLLLFCLILLAMVLATRHN